MIEVHFCEDCGAEIRRSIERDGSNSAGDEIWFCVEHGAPRLLAAIAASCGSPRNAKINGKWICYAPAVPA
jgi:hypothetical protein